jgi:DNA-binding NarL/FixJ family response regulator
VAAVFLLAENRLLREALLRILSKKDDIQVVGAGSYGRDAFDQIAATRANVVILDSVSSIAIISTSGSTCSTISARSLSFCTSPTTSISGWSAMVAITNSLIRRG